MSGRKNSNKIGILSVQLNNNNSKREMNKK